MFSVGKGERYHAGAGAERLPWRGSQSSPGYFLASLPCAVSSNKKHRSALVARDFLDAGRVLGLGLWSCDFSHQWCKIAGDRVFASWCCSQEKTDFTFCSFSMWRWGWSAALSHRELASPRTDAISCINTLGGNTLEILRLGPDFIVLTAAPSEFLPCPSVGLLGIVNKIKSLQELTVSRLLQGRVHGARWVPMGSLGCRSVGQNVGCGSERGLCVGPWQLEHQSDRMIEQRAAKCSVAN